MIPDVTKYSLYSGVNFKMNCAAYIENNLTSNFEKLRYDQQKVSLCLWELFEEKIRKVNDLFIDYLL